jgi:hypothetical protein
MPPKPIKQKSPDRVAIISAVNTYLGFFVLVVLIVEAGLGAVAIQTQGLNQVITIFGMLFVILSLILAVCFFAYRKPDALLLTIASHTRPEVQSLNDFCSRVSGYWWERVKPDEPCAVSFMEIRPDSTTGTVKLKGKVFSRDGEFVAVWESIASCINPNARKIFYNWQGCFRSRLNEPYEGFGEFSFEEYSNKIDKGVGIFFDTNITDAKSTTKKFVEFWRCPQPDMQAMQEGDDKLISDMVRRKSV